MGNGWFKGRKMVLARLLTSSVGLGRALCLPNSVSVTVYLPEDILRII